MFTSYVYATSFEFCFAVLMSCSSVIECRLLLFDGHRTDCVLFLKRKRVLRNTLCVYKTSAFMFQTIKSNALFQEMSVKRSLACS
jgi:hypothetical protein